MKKRYKKTNVSKETEDGFIVFRIEGINPNTGEYETGGWIESEDNLDMDSAAWVADNAQVYNGARVTNQALVFGNAKVHDNGTIIDGRARIYENAEVYNGGKVLENASVSGQAKVVGATLKGDNHISGNTVKIKTDI